MTAPLGPWGPRTDMVILDEAIDGVLSVELALDTDDADESGGGTMVCSHLHGARTLTAEFTIDPSPGFRRMMREWEAAIAARRTFMLGRLADELGKPLFLVRRQAGAVDRVLEAAGIADGYGQLTPQAVRPPIPAPARRR